MISKKRTLIGTVLGVVVATGIAVGAGVGFGIQSQTSSAVQRLADAQELDPILVNETDKANYSALDYQQKFNLDSSVIRFDTTNSDDSIKYEVTSVRPSPGSNGTILIVSIRMSAEGTSDFRTYEKLISGFNNFRFQTETIFNNFNVDDFKFSLNLDAINNVQFAPSDFAFNVQDSLILPTLSTLEITNVEQKNNSVDLTFEVTRTFEGSTVKSSPLVKNVTVVPEFRRLTNEAEERTPTLTNAALISFPSGTFTTINSRPSSDFRRLQAKDVTISDFQPIPSTENVTYAFDTENFPNGVEFLGQTSNDPDATSVRLHLNKISKVDPSYKVAYTKVLDNFASLNMTKVFSQERFGLRLSDNSPLKFKKPSEITVQDLSQPGNVVYTSNTANGVVDVIPPSGIQFTIVARSLASDSSLNVTVAVSSINNAVTKTYVTNLSGFLTDERFAENVFNSVRRELTDANNTSQGITLVDNSSFLNIYAQEYSTINFRFELTNDNQRNLDLVSDRVRLEITSVGPVTGETIAQMNNTGRVEVHGTLSLQGQTTVNLKAIIRVQNKIDLETREINQIVRNLQNSGYVPSLNDQNNLNKSPSEISDADINVLNPNANRRPGSNLPQFRASVRITDRNDALGTLTVVTTISNDGQPQPVQGTITSTIRGFQSRFTANQKLIEQFRNQELVFDFSTETNDRFKYLPSDESQVTTGKFHLQEDFNIPGIFKIFRISNRNDDLGVVTLTVVYGTVDPALNPNPTAPDIVASREVAVQGFRTTRQNTSLNQINSAIMNVMNNPLTIRQSAQERYGKTLVADLDLESDLKQNILFPAPLANPTELRIINVTQNLSNAQADGSATVTIEFTNGDQRAIESFQLSGFASQAKIQNQGILDGAIDDFNNNRLSATEREAYVVKFTSDFVKELTTSDLVNVNNFVTDQTLTRMSSDVDATEYMISLTASKVEVVQVPDPENNPGEINVTIHATLGRNLVDRASATYVVNIKGFPSRSQAQNQVVVNDYLKDENIDRRLQPRLLNSNIRVQKAARSLVLSDFVLDSSLVSTLNLSMSNLRVTSETEVTITVLVSLGEGQSLAQGTYEVTIGRFLNNDQEDILLTINEVIALIEAHEAVNDITSISDVIRGVEGITASAATPQDIIIAARNGVTLEALGPITNPVDNSGSVTFRIQGRKTSQGGQTTTFSNNQRVTASLFQDQRQILINNAPELTYRVKDGVFLDAPSIQNDGNFAQFFELAVPNNDARYVYEIASIQPQTTTGASNGSSAILTIKVSLSSDLTTSRNYTVPITNLVPTATLDNARVVQDFLNSLMGQGDFINVSEAIKAQKSAPELEIADINFDVTTNIRGIVENRSDIMQDPADQRGAIVRVTLEAGFGTENAFSIRVTRRITGLQLPDRAANETTLRRYIGSNNRDTPILTAETEENRGDISIDMLNNNPSNFFILNPTATSNSNITQMITQIERSGSTNDATVTVTVALGEGDRRATATYTLTFSGFASAQRAENLRVANAYLANENKEQPRLQNNQRPNEVNIELASDNSAISQIWEINANDAANPRIRFSIDSVRLDPTSGTPGVIVTVRITVPQNSPTPPTEDVVSLTYEVKIADFLTRTQTPNFEKAKRYFDNVAGRSLPTLKANVDKSRTPVSLLTPNNFDLEQPPASSGLRLEITNIDLPERSDSTARLTITIVAGTGADTVRSLSYTHDIDGFSTDGKAINQEAVDNYVANNNLRLNPVLNPNINQASTAAETIVLSNFTIATPPQEEGRPQINLSLLSLEVILDPTSQQRTTVRVTVEARAGSSASDFASATYTVDFPGFATTEVANAIQELTDFVQNNARPRPVLINPQDAEIKSVGQLKLSDFRIASPNGFVVTITKINALANNPTVAEITVSVQKEGLLGEGHPIRTYTERISGFASADKLTNIALINRFITEAQANPDLRPALNAELAARKDQLAVINLLNSNYEAPDLSTSNDFSNLFVQVVAIREKGDTEPLQRVALVTVSVSIGSGEDFFSNVFTFEDSGFNNRLSGENLRLINNYVNSGSRVKPTLNPLSQNKNPYEAGMDDVRLGASGDTNIVVSIDSITPRIPNNDPNFINSNAVVVRIRVKTIDTTQNDFRIYEEVVSGFRTVGRQKVETFIANRSENALLPQVFRDQDTQGNPIIISPQNYSDFLPQIFASRNNVLIDYPDNSRPQGIDPRDNYEITFDNFEANNENGNLTITITVRYRAQGTSNQIVIGDFSSQYTIRLDGFSTRSQQIVKDAPNYDFTFLGSANTTTGSRVSNLNFALTRSAQADKDSKPELANFTYRVNNVVVINEGRSVELTIEISNIAQTAQRFYTQTIDGFLSLNQFNNRTNVANFINGTDRTLEFADGVINSETTTVTSLIDQFVNDQTEDKSETFKNLNINFNGILRRTVISAERDPDSETAVIFTVKVEGILGPQSEHVEDTYMVPIRSLKSEVASELFKTRESIQNAYRNPTEANSNYRLFKIKDTSINKIIEAGLSNETIIANDFITINDFELTSAQNLQELVTNKNLTLELVNVRPLNSNSFILGSVSLTLRIAGSETGGNSSPSSEFSITIGGFKTFQEVFEEYINSATRLKPESIHNLDQRWNMSANAGRENFVNTTLELINPNFTVKAENSNINVDGLDDSIINFDYVLASQMTIKFGENTPRVLNFQASYRERIGDFKRRNTPRSDYRIQFNGQNVYRNINEITPAEAQGARRLDIDGDLSEIPGDLFNTNSELIELILNSGITSIGANAFASANQLTELTLPPTISEIGMGAFMSSPLTKIEGLAKTRIRSLKYVTFARANETIQVAIRNIKIEILKELAKASDFITMQDGISRDSKLPTEIVANINDPNIANNQKFIKFSQTALLAQSDVRLIFEPSDLATAEDRFGSAVIEYRAEFLDNTGQVITGTASTFSGSNVINSLQDTIRRFFPRIKDASTYIDFSKQDTIRLYNSGGTEQRIQRVSDINDRNAFYQSVNSSTAPTTNPLPDLGNVNRGLEGRVAGFTKGQNLGLNSPSLSKTTLQEGGSIFMQFYSERNSTTSDRFDIFSGSGSIFTVQESSNRLAFTNIAGERISMNRRFINKPTNIVGLGPTEGSKVLDVMTNGGAERKGLLGTNDLYQRSVVMEVHRYADRLKFTLYIYIPEKNKIARNSFEIKNPSYFDLGYSALGAAVNTFAGNIGSVIAFNNPKTNLTYQERVELGNLLAFKWFGSGFYDWHDESQANSVKPPSESIDQNSEIGDFQASNKTQHTSWLTEDGGLLAIDPFSR